MTRRVERAEAEKKKKFCHKGIKRCYDSPALSRRYGFRGSVSALLARAGIGLTSFCSADSDGRVSSEGAKVGLFPFSRLKSGGAGGGCLNSPVSRSWSRVRRVGAGSGQKSRRGTGRGAARASKGQQVPRGRDPGPFSRH